MSDKTRIALENFVVALERHHEALAHAHMRDDSTLQQAVDQVEQRFLDYEEALLESYDEYLPLELAEEE